MKRFTKFIFFCMLFIIYNQLIINAGIIPLKNTESGVTAIDDSGLIIQSAEITVTPKNNSYQFSCRYVLKALDNIEDILLGIPSDSGYTLQAGYMSDLNVYLNNEKITTETYYTSYESSSKWDYLDIPLNFKWNAFNLSANKDSAIILYMTYNISWKMFDSNQSSYYIIPFFISMDRLLCKDSFDYRIKYINDDIISIPDTKIVLSSLPSTYNIPDALLSPIYDEGQIIWSLKTSSDFQNFRLVVFSFKHLAALFNTGTSIDNTIEWSILDKNYLKLAQMFEDIANKKTNIKLSNELIGTAAFISSEYYFRIGDYNKALDMLSPRYKISFWNSAIKYNYINSLKLKKEENYTQMQNSLDYLSSEKEFVLAYVYSQNQTKSIKDIIEIKKSDNNIEKNIQINKKYSLYYSYITKYLIPFIFTYLILIKLKKLVKSVK